MKRLLLIDNDAFVLLAGSGHMDSVLALLDLSYDNCRYNAPFPFVFRKKIKPGLPAPLGERIEAAIQRIGPLEITPSAEIVEQFQSIYDIDVGEAILFGVLAEQPAALLTTNDKRALRALATSPALESIRKSVSGRIVSVESIIKRLADEHTVPAIASGFVEISIVDKRLTVIFSQHNIANPDQCANAIASYLRAAIEECGEGFFHSH